MKPSRLLLQGFTNFHRKTLFRLAAIALLSYLVFVPDPWKLPGTMVLSAQFAGVLLVFAGILGRILATISIGGHKDRRIMKTELYSICRNPLYFASLLMAIGVGTVSGRLDFLVLVMAGYLVIFYPMMLNEAKYLREHFEDFAEYEARVPLFFPSFKLWEERKHIEINFKLVKRTLLDSSLALLAIPVIVLVRAFG